MDWHNPGEQQLGIVVQYAYCSTTAFQGVLYQSSSTILSRVRNQAGSTAPRRTIP